MMIVADGAGSVCTGEVQPFFLSLFHKQHSTTTIHTVRGILSNPRLKEMGGSARSHANITPCCVRNLSILALDVCGLLSFVISCVLLNSLVLLAL